MNAVRLAFWVLACGTTDDSARADSGTDSTVDSDSAADSRVDDSDVADDSSTSDDSGDCEKTSWYQDADGDGYGDSASSRFECVAPEGFVGDDSDCDDTHAEAYPGSVERWTDGLDTDCDGDASATSIADTPLWQAIGRYENADAGLSVATSDFDGDTYADLVVGGSNGELDGELRRGIALVFSGPLSETASPVDETYAAAALYGAKLDYWSNVCAVGDLDADGFSDLVIAAPLAGGYSAGAVYIPRGPISGVVDMTLETQVFLGASRGEVLGVCAGPGDVDGDGANDVVLGASDAAGGGNGEGSVYLLRGPAEHASLEDADQILRGEDPKEYIGYRVAAQEDLNGDGLQDFSVSNAWNSKIPADGVAAYLIMDYIPGILHPRDVGTIVHYDSGSASTSVSAASVGDINGDGYVDAAFAGTGFLETSELRVIEGPFGAKPDLYLSKDSDIAFSSSSEGPTPWISFATQLGDWNGDGTGVLAIADAGFATAEAMAHHDCANEAGCGQGALYLIAQPIDPGAYDLATSADRLEGTYANGYLGGNRYGGFTLAGGNDLNGDGFPDLAFGAPYADSTYVDSGAAYVLFGGGSP